MKNEIHTKENLYHQSNQANSNNTMLNHNDQAYKAVQNNRSHQIKQSNNGKNKNIKENTN
jgi:hypothetical protein